MKCEKCGNEYPSFYYFATEKICKSCYNQMAPEEQAQQQPLVYDNMYYSEYGWRATFGYRLGAAMLDYLIISVILMIVLFASGIFSDYKDSFELMLTNPELIEEFTKAILPYSFVVLFMYSSLEIFLAASLGKIILGLQIGDENRKEASYEKLAIRYALKHSDNILSLVGFLSVMSFIDTVASISSFVIIVGFFFVLTDKRQAFHDMAAKTAVFRRVDILRDNEQDYKIENRIN